MKKIILSIVISMAFASLASARGAVFYNCAGFEPGTPGKGSLSKQSVVFNLISAQDETTLQIVSQSSDPVDPANATLIVEAGDCDFDMQPDAQFPAYRVSVSGSCGTKVQHNFKGICFFE